MAHHRRIIREAIVAALKAAGTAAGQRVHDSPADPRSTFPALVVTDDGERQGTQVMLATRAARPFERRYRVEVAAEVVQVADYARQRDDLMAEVEACMAAAALPGVKDLSPTSYSTLASDNAERPIRVGVQTFEITYYTTQGDPSAAL